MILLSKEMFTILNIGIFIVYVAIHGFVTANIVKSYGIGLGKAIKGDR